MKIAQCISAMLLLTIVCIHSMAQQRVKLNVNYSVNVPTGNFREYISKTSFRGWNANITFRLTDQIAVGAATGFQDFYQKNDRILYRDEEGSDISAVITNSIQSIPLLATVHYSLTPAGQIRPYVGLGVGGNFIMHSTFLGEFNIEDNKIKPAARPEVGVFILVKRGSEAGINVSGSFNFMPYDEDNVKNMNSWGINVGARFPLR